MTHQISGGVYYPYIVNLETVCQQLLSGQSLDKYGLCSQKQLHLNPSFTTQGRDELREITMSADGPESQSWPVYHAQIEQMF